MRQLVTAKKLDIVDSARLFALVAIATDDAFIAVFEAKYHYNFWRPITAIRNADLSDNPATQRDASWLPLGDTPMHPEYPCAHCITSIAAAAVLQSVFGNDIPEVSMTSATAPGVTRRWTRLQDYADEVAVARIYGGFHYRFSNVAAQDMGRKIAELAVNTQMRAQRIGRARRVDGANHRRAAPRRRTELQVRRFLQPRNMAAIPLVQRLERRMRQRALR